MLLLLILILLGCATTYPVHHTDTTLSQLNANHTTMIAGVQLKAGNTYWESGDKWQFKGNSFVIQSPGIYYLGDYIITGNLSLDENDGDQFVGLQY